MALIYSAIICCVILSSIISAQDIVFPEDTETCQTASHGVGQCVELAQCLSAQRIIQYGGKPVSCGFAGRTPLVCCPRLAGLGTGNGPVSVTLRGVAPPRINFACGQRGLRELFIAGRKRRSTTNFDYPDEQLLPPGPPFRPPLISVPLAGSVVSFRNSWPWMALLGRNKGRDTDFFCSGSLINENYVITAAHCTLDPKPFFARLREHDYNQRTENIFDNFPEDFNISDVIYHPKFESNKGYHDIALLKLASPATFKEGIHPVCLPWGNLANENIIGKLVTLTGWGQTGFVGFMSNILREVNVTVFNPAVCERSYSTLNDFSSTFPEGMTPENIICAGVPEGGKDACQGDSGGPMVQYRREEDGYTLAAIISKGFGCGKKDFPGLYAPLRDHFTLDWIKRVAFQ